MPSKGVRFDDETWDAVRLLASDSMRDFQDLADEAFRDLLAKHNRPVGFRAQMKGSAKEGIQNEGEMVERKPLTLWEEYAQALLFTNEAAFVK